MAKDEENKTEEEAAFLKYSALEIKRKDRLNKYHEARILSENAYLSLETARQEFMQASVRMEVSWALYKNVAKIEV